MASIAAIVVSLAERHSLLTEALDSVHRQTRQPDDTVIGVDPRRLGEVENMNRLIAATDCDWLAFLHDDDLWTEDHLATAEKHFDQGDVIVSRYECDGRPQASIERWHDNFGDLRFTNWFPPSCVIARKSVFGEWCHPQPPWHWVDWTNWNRLLDDEAVFVDTHRSTVTYRFGPWGNGSWGG